MTKVKVNLLIDHSPLDRNGIWGDFAVTTKMVKEMLENNKFNETPYFGNTAGQHAKRIAYFIKNGWKDSITLMVGIPEMRDCLPYIGDGYHRLAAAILRNDEYIDVGIDGSLKYAEDLFGVKF
jgi:hypothetical protein